MHFFGSQDIAKFHTPVEPSEAALQKYSFNFFKVCLIVVKIDLTRQNSEKWARPKHNSILLRVYNAKRISDWESA
jgi:hypothetical protein